MTGMEVPTAADERFARRSVYWRPGMSVIAEPWVTLVETNVGQQIVPQGRDALRAAARVAELHSAALDGYVSAQGVVVVAAAVVDPRGDVRDWWATGDGPAPIPGGPGWFPALHRVLAVQACPHCGADRHPGTWVCRETPGCALCLPQRESGRRWPNEAPEPPAERVKARKASRRKDPPPDEVTALRPIVDSPSDGRLL